MTTPEVIKPAVQLSGQDGNVFNLIGLAAKALKRAGLKQEASDLTSRAFKADSYGAVLELIAEYCEVS
jgi:hypothetical protein